MMDKSLELVTAKDGAQIAVWKIANDVESNQVNQGQNILLIHGTFSDKRVSLGVAGYLARLGHSCYIMEWRGHGDWSIPSD